MQLSAFLILKKNKGREPRVTRVTQRRPSLAANEALIRLELDVPDDVFEAPIHTVQVEKRSIAVAVEVDEPL